MNKAVETRMNRARPGGWVPQDQAHIRRWIARLKHYVTQQSGPLAAPIAELRDLAAGKEVSTVPAAVQEYYRDLYKTAGADGILTYFALEAAEYLSNR